jgi:polyhydroxyalkanoate synthesis regulator protein
MQWLVPRYLEQAMAAFAGQQEQMRKNLQNAFGGLFPFGGLEEMSKQNMALFEKTMKMFSPFPAGSGEEKAGGAKPEPNIEELTKRLNALQSQLDALSKKEK